MLDNLKYIHEKDPGDMLGQVERQWQQLEKEYQIELKPFKPENIVWSGMGGSAMPGGISASWPGYNVPFEVVRNYDIPKYVSSKTLFIANSYSGTTEEALTALDQASKRGAYICVITSGGQLAEIANKNNYPTTKIPTGFQPRITCLYQLKALVTILSNLGLIDKNKTDKEIEAAVRLLKRIRTEWQATVPVSKNLAKQIALESAGKSVVVYSGPKLASVAYKWKVGFNENAKQVAWWNQYPEFSHNEFIGWTNQPVIKPYCVIDLKSKLENPRIQKRFDISAKLLSGLRPEPIEVNLEGDSLLEQIVYGIMLGDLASIYAALLSGVNPEPVALVEKFKKEMVKE